MGGIGHIESSKTVRCPRKEHERTDPWNPVVNDVSC